MNPLSVSALSALIFAAMLIVWLTVLKLAAIRWAGTAPGQALGWLVH